MALSDLQVRTAKPAEKLRKLSDGQGLQLWITPDGAKRWRLAYRFAGRQKALALGVYPATSLKDAREGREAARKLLASGRDPSAVRKLTRATEAAAAAITFDLIAAELLAKKRAEAKADRTLTKIDWLLGFASPFIGARPISDIAAP